MSLKMEMRDADGTLLRQQKLTVKRSRDGPRASESLVIDRRNPDATTKEHDVEVWDPQLRKWTVVHEHEESYPAKHRRTSTNSGRNGACDSRQSDSGAQ